MRCRYLTKNVRIVDARAATLVFQTFSGSHIDTDITNNMTGDDGSASPIHWLADAMDDSDGIEKPREAWRVPRYTSQRGARDASERIEAACLQDAPVFCVEDALVLTLDHASPASDVRERSVVCILIGRLPRLCLNAINQAAHVTEEEGDFVFDEDGGDDNGPLLPPCAKRRKAITVSERRYGVRCTNTPPGTTALRDKLAYGRILARLIALRSVFVLAAQLDTA